MKKVFSKFLFFIYTLGLMVIIFTTSFSFGNKENIFNSIKNDPDITIKDVSLGYQYSFAVINDGASDYLYTWGRNTNGELGLGDKNDRTSPTKVTTLPSGTIKQVSTGWFHSAAIVNDGTEDHLYTWGYNYSGELGLGHTAGKTTPTEVTELPGGEIKQISLGKNHSAAITNDGTNDHLYTWGYNKHGELGLGHVTRELSPTEVTELPGGEIKQVSLGENHSAAVTNDGTTDHLYTWGYNGFGQLGLGDTTNRNTPTEVTELPKGEIKQISLGNGHSIINITIGGIDSVNIWGDNSRGALGLGETGGEHNSPTQIFPDHIKSLINASAKSVEFTTAKITVDTSINESANEITPYSLEVFDGTNVIGKSDATNLTTDGPKTFNLTNLTPNTDYGDVKVRIVDNTNIESNTFNITTSIQSISELKNFKTVGDAGSNSVDVSVEAGVAINEDVNEYALELIDNTDTQISGSSVATGLNTSGLQEFTITGLTPGTNYGIVKLRVVGTDIVSNEIQLTTSLNEINSLDSASATSVESTSAVISVDAIVSSSFNSNEEVKNYSLEVIDSTELVIGTSDAIDLHTTGPQTFDLTNLDPNKNYGEVKVRLSGNHDIKSNTFNLTTLKQDISELTNFVIVGEPASSSVDVSVVAGVPSTNEEEVNDYSLELVDSSDTKISGSSTEDSLNTSGTKTFTITGLTPGTNYGKVKLRVINTSIVSNAIQLTTPLNEITSLESAATVGVATDTSVKISVDAIVSSSFNSDEEVENYSLEVFDGTNVIGNSDATDLDTSGTQEFKLGDLSPNTEYNSVVVRIVGTSIVSNEFNIKTSKQDISELTNFAIVGEVGSNSVDVQVDAGFSTNEDVDVNEYSLELIDNTDTQISGSSVMEGLNTSGTQTFTITGLTPATDYGQVKLRVVDTNVKSNSVKLETTQKQLTGLEDAKIVGDTKETSVKISVNAVYNPTLNEDVDNYDLEVVEGTDVIGNSSATNLHSDGVQTFNLTELDSNKPYTDVFVRIVGTDIVSNTFSFTTQKKSASVLDNAHAIEGETTYNSAIISVDVSTSTNSEIPLQDYGLYVADKYDPELKSETYTYEGEAATTGTKEIEINGLDWETVYENLYVGIEGTEIKIDVDDFKTDDSPINPQPDTFAIVENSIKHNSFMFSVDIDFIGEYSSEDFDPSILTLTSNGEKLKTSFVKKENDSTYIYKVSGLKAHKKYDNFKIKIANSEKTISINNKSVTTKRNQMITISLISLITIILLILVVVIILLIVKRKKDTYESYGGGSGTLRGGW